MPATSSGPILVGVDAGATKTVALAVWPGGEVVGRAAGEGANPKRHGLAVAADRIAGLVREAAGGSAPALVLVAGAGIDRPNHARALEVALAGLAPTVIVVNDTLAVLRAGTPDAVGLVVPVSTGGNVIGRAADGRVTDRGHGIFGGGYVLGALAARAARRRGELTEGVTWRGRRPGPEVAGLALAVVRAAEAGEPFPARMVARWCGRVRDSVREECERLALGASPAVIVYGGLGEASPWLASRVRAAVLEGAPGARLVPLAIAPVEGAALLARDAFAGAPIRWEFTPRR